MAIFRWGPALKGSVLVASDFEKFLRIRLLVLTQYTNVTDVYSKTNRRTDTARRHRPRLALCIASRGKNGKDAIIALFTVTVLCHCLTV